METPVDVSISMQRLLLFCGILAPLIYLGTDLLAGKLLKGYRFVSQSMSELSASGSPTRPLVIVLTLVAGVLLIAFAAGVWRWADQALLPRVVAVLVIGNVATGFIAMLFFPTRYGERPKFRSAGVLVMFLSVVCFVLAMVCGAAAFDGWLRILSIAIPASYIILAIVRFATAGASSAAGAAPSVGAQERTMSYSFLLWILAVAIYLA
jgi:hypothetical protein